MKRNDLDSRNLVATWWSSQTSVEKSARPGGTQDQVLSASDTDLVQRRYQTTPYGRIHMYYGPYSSEEARCPPKTHCPAAHRSLYIISIAPNFPSATEAKHDSDASPASQIIDLRISPLSHLSTACWLLLEDEIRDRLFILLLRVSASNPFLKAVCFSVTIHHVALVSHFCCPSAPATPPKVLVFGGEADLDISACRRR